MAGEIRNESLNNELGLESQVLTIYSLKSHNITSEPPMQTLKFHSFVETLVQTYFPFLSKPSKSIIAKPLRGFMNINTSFFVLFYFLNEVIIPCGLS